VSHMSELQAIVTRARELRRVGEPFLVATVVRVRGSAYRRPGARMLITGGGAAAGSVSAGCLERDLVRRGFWRTRASRAVVVTYDGTSDEDVRVRVGVGCDGVVSVLVERFDEPLPCDPIEAAGRCLAEERPLAMATVFESLRPDVPIGARLLVEENGRTVSGVEHPTTALDLTGAVVDQLGRGSRATEWRTADGDVHALVERMAPPPHLFVFGSGDDAVPVLTMARLLGWGVTICDRQSRFSTLERFSAADRVLALDASAVRSAVDRRARPLAVVLSHDYAYDQAVVRALLGSRAEYVGLLGPRARTARMLSEIESDGGPPARDAWARIHAPVGLDLGAETPAEVALAIVAEAQAVLAGASAGLLRDRRGPIHAGTTVAHSIDEAAE
jgi:xanthine dehydrogenase accessory factor